ncbi:MAG TPA: hypothetical protein VF800_02895 [Telluria sp.]|jgi:hypothetical protein
MKPNAILAVLGAVMFTSFVLTFADQAMGIRRDKYLIDHKCRLIEASGAPADQIYECDTGLTRLRDIG